MPLTRPQPALLSSRTDVPYSPSIHPTITFTLTAGGLLTPKIKCIAENKKDSFTYQSKSENSTTRSMTVKDHQGLQVCKIRSKGEHLLDLYLTTESKDINVQFRDMIAFKKAVEKNSLQLRKIPGSTASEYDFDRPERFISDMSTPNGVCWAFEFEGRIYQWTAGSGQGILAPPGSDVLLCHTTSLGPATRVAKLQSSHTGASDKLIIQTSALANVIDKTGLHILLLGSVLSLMEIMNDRSRELLDFD
ncbi:hypothetical protein BGZ76_010202 [Entomortierella beljakovae]|nr:hypothetical protein BGZ76_010202 [Entomortierella beljakovae]